MDISHGFLLLFARILPENPGALLFSLLVALLVLLAFLFLALPFFLGLCTVMCLQSLGTSVACFTWTKVQILTDLLVKRCTKGINNDESIAPCRWCLTFPSPSPFCLNPRLAFFPEARRMAQCRWTNTRMHRRCAKREAESRLCRLLGHLWTSDRQKSQ